MAIDWLRGKRVHTLATEAEFFVDGNDVVLDPDPDETGDGDFAYLYVDGPEPVEST